MAAAILVHKFNPYTSIESQMNSCVVVRRPEHVRRLKSNVQSLQRLLVSCETSASVAENSVSFYPQPSPRMEGHGPGRSRCLEHNQGSNRIFALYTFFYIFFFMGKITQDNFEHDIQTYLMIS